MMFQFSKNQTLLALFIIFLLVQLIGGYAGYNYIQLVNAKLVQPMFENPADVNNAFTLFAYILMMTALLLILIKFKKSLIRVIEAMAIFFTAEAVFELTIPIVILEMPVGIFLALTLTAWKIMRPTYLSQNVAMLFSVAGAGAIIGASFAVFPVIIFMLVLSMYDFISVFYTKHMVYLAKAITEKPTAFTASFPTKTKKYQHVFQLGGGDLVIPLVFSVSVLNYHGMTSAVMSAAGALIALLILFSLVLKKPGKALPALPPVCAGACIGFALSLLI